VIETDEIETDEIETDEVDEGDAIIASRLVSRRTG